jgi:hypothetical protein
MLFLTVALSGCSEPTQNIQKDQQKKVAEVAINPTDFIQPTTVPNNNAQRSALLNTLDINANSPQDKRRLALFTRYAIFADNTDRKLPVLEQLLSEMDLMRKALPNDYELMAAFGSATSLKAIFFLDNLGKTNLLSKKGSRYLDRAIKSAPTNLGVRMYRGITYAEMPAFLGKARQAIEDFNLLRQGANGRKQANFSAMLDYYYAMALIKNQQKDSGVKQLNSVISRNITPWKARASVLLKKEG